MAKFHFSLLLLLGLLFIGNACSEKDNYEIVDSTDILPQAEGDYNYDEEQQSTGEIVYSEIQNQLLKLLPGITFKEENNLIENQTPLLPNRLGYKEKQEVYFNLDSTDFYLIDWTFSDSSKTVNAFYNWLDCFGPNCRSIKVNEQKNLEKNAFAVWVTQESITFLTSEYNFKSSHWEKLLFEDKEEEDFYFLLKQNVRGQTNWPYSEIKE